MGEKLREEGRLVTPAGGATGTAGATAAGAGADTTATSNAGKASLEGVGGGPVATTVMWGISTILYFVQYVLSTILVYAAGLLNYTFQANVGLNPADWKVVQAGWTISRDIANSLFILIILWIAFTIIFGVEQLGGKKLFVRVLVVAMLINFSLVAVTAVFGFSNAFAKVFANQIPQDVAGVMANALKVQTVIGSIDEVTKNEIVGKKQAEERYQVAMIDQRKNQYDFGIKTSVLATLGVQNAQADLLTGAAAGCAAGLLVGPFGCVAGGITGAIIDTLVGNYFENSFARNLNSSINLAIGSIFIFITIVAFLVAAVTLTIRMLAMIVLSIFAPLALLTQVVPVGSLKGYWNMWTSALFRWAFFAPGFYFLFYLSLVMLQQFDQGTSQTKSTVAYLDLSRIMQMLMALGLMIMAVKFAKKTGGAMADAAIGGAQKIGTFALGAATGGATMAAGALARQQAPRIEKAIGGIGKIPVLGGVAAVLAAPGTRRVAEFMEGQKAGFEKEKGETNKKSTDFLIQERKRTPFWEKQKLAAIDSVIYERKESGKLKDAGVSTEASLKIAEQFGEKAVLTILKSRPDLITAQNVPGGKEKAQERVASELKDRGRTVTEEQAARMIVMDKMKPEDVANIDWKSVDSGKRDDLVHDLIFMSGSVDKLRETMKSLFTLPVQARNDLNASIQKAWKGDGTQAGQEAARNNWKNLEEKDSVTHGSYMRYMAGRASREFDGIGGVPDFLADKVRAAGSRGNQKKPTPLKKKDEGTKPPEPGQAGYTAPGGGFTSGPSTRGGGGGSSPLNAQAQDATFTDVDPTRGGQQGGGKPPAPPSASVNIPAGGQPPAGGPPTGTTFKSANNP